VHQFLCGCTLFARTNEAGENFQDKNFWPASDGKMEKGALMKKRIADMEPGEYGDNGTDRVMRLLSFDGCHSVIYERHKRTAYPCVYLKTMRADFLDGQTEIRIIGKFEEVK
jgi:hypothetical protein